MDLLLHKCSLLFKTLDAWVQGATPTFNIEALCFVTNLQQLYTFYSEISDL